VLNYWAGTLVGIPALVSVTSYRSVHWPHHNYTRSERDPDEFTNAIRHPGLRRAAFFFWLVLGGVIYLGAHVPINAVRLARGRDKLLVVLEYATVVIVFSVAIGALAAANRMDIFVHGWAYPAVAAGMLLNVRGVAEHMLTRGDDVFSSTRTVLSNAPVRFFMNNLNFHLEHHLVPSVPWYNLPRLHALLREDLAAAVAPVTRSYVLLLLGAIRRGGVGVLPDAELTAVGTAGRAVQRSI
jgi:fatty acid desaturase